MSAGYEAPDGLDLSAAADGRDESDPEFAAWLADEVEARAEHHFHLSVAGVTHRNDDGSDRQALIARCRPRDPLELVPEPDNPFHNHAVKVMTKPDDGGPAAQLGYLPKSTAAQVCRALVKGERFAAHVRDRRETTHREHEDGTRNPIHALVIVILHLNPHHRANAIKAERAEIGKAAGTVGTEE